MTYFKWSEKSKRDWHNNFAGLPAGRGERRAHMNDKKVKKYRVNGSEHFNLMSMYDHLKCIEIDMIEGVIPYDATIYDRIEEVEGLLEKACCVGAAVDWPTLKRIREIKNERQLIRYNRALAAGAAENEAAIAFSL